MYYYSLGIGFAPLTKINLHTFNKNTAVDSMDEDRASDKNAMKMVEGQPHQSIAVSENILPSAPPQHLRSAPNNNHQLHIC